MRDLVVGERRDLGPHRGRDALVHLALEVRRVSGTSAPSPMRVGMLCPIHPVSLLESGSGGCCEPMLEARAGGTSVAAALAPVTAQYFGEASPCRSPEPREPGVVPVAARTGRRAARALKGRGPVGERGLVTRGLGRTLGAGGHSLASERSHYRCLPGDNVALLSSSAGEPARSGPFAGAA